MEVPWYLINGNFSKEPTHRLFAAEPVNENFQSLQDYLNDTVYPSLAPALYWQRTGTTLSPRTLTDSLGVGIATAAANIHSLATTEQLRLGYDATKYTSFTVDSSGGLTIHPLYNTADSAMIIGASATSITHKLGIGLATNLIESQCLHIYGKRTRDPYLTYAAQCIVEGNADDSFIHVTNTDTTANWSGIGFNGTWGIPQWVFETGNTAGDGTTAMIFNHHNGAIWVSALALTATWMVGIGPNMRTPDSYLHVFGASAGTVVSSTDLMTLEDDTSNGLSILLPNTATASILFGDPDDNDIGGITYNHSTNIMSLRAGTVDVVTIAATGLSTAYAITSTLAIGTAPFSITSTTLVNNLNVQYWNSLAAPANAAGYLYNDGAGALSWAALTITHEMLSATHTDSVVGTVVDGDIIIGNVTPKWERLAISIPAANIRNVLGVDNGELRPSWKAALDATNPTTIAVGDAAAPGTSLIFAHRDHQHASPATWTATAHNILSTTHGDTLADTVIAGDLMVGNATPKWARLPNVAIGSVLTSTGVGTALAYTTTPQVTGISLNGAPGWIRPAANSTNALNIQDLAGNFLMGFDTTNMRVAIGTATPSYLLDIQKAQNASTYIRIGNSTVGTSAIAGFLVTNDRSSGGNGMAVSIKSSGYTPIGASLADQVMFRTDTTITNGMLFNTGAAAPIVFAIQDVNVARFHTNGYFGVGADATAPADVFVVHRNVNGGTWGNVRNLTNGTLAKAAFYASASNASLEFGATSTGLTTAGLLTANLAYISSGSAANGLLIYNTTTAPIKFATNNVVGMTMFNGNNVCIGTNTAAVSLLEVYSATASPIVTITGLHATSYDPQINFRTDSPATVKFAMGVDSTDDSFWLNHGATLGANTDFTITAAGGVGIGTLAAATSSLEILKHSDNLGWAAISANATIHSSVDGTHSAQIIYLAAEGSVDNGITNSGNITAFYNQALKTGDGTLSGYLYAAWLRYGMTAGVLGTCAGLYIDPQFGTSGSMTNSVDIYIYGRTGSVTPTNEWCINSLHDVPSWMIGNFAIGGAAQYKTKVPGQFFNEAYSAGAVDRALVLSGGDDSVNAGVSLAFNTVYGTPGSYMDTSAVAGWMAGEIQALQNPTGSVKSYETALSFLVNDGDAVGDLIEVLRLCGNGGSVRIPSLAGVGTRNVVVDAAGNLSAP